jgi:hypothetical protein
MLGYASFVRARMSHVQTPRPGAPAQNVRARTPPENTRIAAARRRLSRLTGGTVGIQSDIYAQYVSMVPNRRPMPYRVRPGAVRPIIRCGLGLRAPQPAER